MHAQLTNPDNPKMKNICQHEKSQNFKICDSFLSCAMLAGYGSSLTVRADDGASGAG
jgi:hypothetical protein